MGRNAKVIRKTSETDIEIYFETDGTGEAKVDTGIGFFDHMLKSFARHGLFNLDVKVKGDVWTLKYDGVPTENQKIQIIKDGPVYDYSADPDGPGPNPIVEIYTSEFSSKDDLSMSGTH